MKKKKDDGIRVISTPPFKLKDKPTRNFQAINIYKQFGFWPEVIIIEKVYGANNMIIVRAVLTEEERRKEDERITKMSDKEQMGLGVGKYGKEVYKNGESSNESKSKQKK